MSWRRAFLLQAASDAKVMDLLNEGKCEYAHQLHYLQMFSEKLARGMLASEGSNDPPEPSHAGLVSMLRTLKGRQDVGLRLGYRDRASFRLYVDSLLPFAQQVQALAPAIAGFARPNPEYPWRPTREGAPVAPCDYTFPDFDPKRQQMAKLVRLLRDLSRVIG